MNLSSSWIFWVYFNFTKEYKAWKVGYKIYKISLVQEVKSSRSLDKITYSIMNDKIILKNYSKDNDSEFSKDFFIFKKFKIMFTQF